MKINLKAGIKSKFSDHKTQNQIESYLKHWLKDTGHEITSDDRKTHGLRFTNNRGMEADIFVPDLKLVIEYQGIHHYEPIHGEERLKRQQTNDQEKREAFQKEGYVLIEIPYSEWQLGDSEQALRELILNKLKAYPRNLTAKRIERALAPKSGELHVCTEVLKDLPLAVGQ